MYLSKLCLDRRSPSVRQAFRNCQDMHRNLQSLFHASRGEAAVLYRLYRGSGECAVYVLSEQPPVLPADGRSGPGMSLAGCRDMAPLESGFVPGARFCFDLLACPSKKVAGPGKNSKRRALRTEQERADWMRRKGRQAGFEVLSSAETGEQRIRGMRGGSQIAFSAYCFSGVLLITDGARFRASWKKGIGPEKAYGLGLLLLR